MPCLYSNRLNSFGSHAFPASRTRLFNPNRRTNSRSVSSFPVNNSAHTYRLGFATRAASNTRTPTWRGVLWQLSIRNPWNVLARVVAYLIIYSQSQGLSSGPDPYRSLTQSPQTMTSRRRYALDGGMAKFSRGFAFHIQPLLAKEYLRGSVLASGRRVKYGSTRGNLRTISGTASGMRVYALCRNRSEFWAIII